MPNQCLRARADRCRAAGCWFVSVIRREAAGAPKHTTTSEQQHDRSRRPRRWWRKNRRRNSCHCGARSTRLEHRRTSPSSSSAASPAQVGDSSGRSAVMRAGSAGRARRRDVGEQVEHDDEDRGDDDPRRAGPARHRRSARRGSSRPMPGIEKICSVMISPPNEARRVERHHRDERDQRVAERVLARSTLRRGTPLARAVRM